jgi:DNA-binding NtrC family response regulator
MPMIKLVESAPAASSLPRVLFVDDEPDRTDLLILMLTRYCDISSRSVTSALHAIQLLEVEQFDLVVSDQIMLGMHGTVFLQLAADRWPDMRRILLSAYTSAAMIIDSADYIDQVLDKLLDPRIVSAAICWHAKHTRGAGA